MLSRRCLWPALLALFCPPALAQDFSWSAYGTLGYAISNRGYAYERSIDDHGTWSRDSVIGAQGDIRFTPQWSATAQVKFAPSLNHDRQYDLLPAWAFLAWRPTDDWLLRAGRMRLPLYMNSEALDVGVTHDMARLPTEMYSILPSTDYNGVSADKNWALGDNDLSLGIYSGRIKTAARFWLRDGIPAQVPSGVDYVGINMRLSGAVLTLRTSEGVWRAGVHRTSTRQGNGENIAKSVPFVQVAPGVGYYQVSNEIPGPGLPSTKSFRNTIYTLGLEQQIAPGWRAAAEFARNVQSDTELGSDTRGGYVALFRQMGRATPYLSFGLLRASSTQLGWYQKLTETTLPSFIPGADQINAAQRICGETIYAVDQRSLAFGGSYAIDSAQKLKLEWKRTRIGQVSRLVDTPAGSPTIRDTSIDVLSVNYSFSF